MHTTREVPTARDSACRAVARRPHLGSEGDSLEGAVGAGGHEHEAGGVKRQAAQHVCRLADIARDGL